MSTSTALQSVQLSQGPVSNKSLQRTEVQPPLHPFSKELELLVEHLHPLPFLLFHLDLILVTMAMFPLPIARFLELNVRGLSEDLDSILSYGE